MWRYPARLVNHEGMNLKRNAARLLEGITVALLLAGWVGVSKPVLKMRSVQVSLMLS